MHSCPDSTLSFWFSSRESCFFIAGSLTTLVWKCPNCTPACASALPEEWLGRLFPTVQLVFLSGNTSLLWRLLQASASLGCRCRKINKTDWYAAMQEGKLWHLWGILWYINHELANTSAMNWHMAVTASGEFGPAVLPATDWYCN